MNAWKWTIAELAKSGEARGEAITEARVRVYISDFERLGFDDEACARAIAEVRGESRFFPTIAEVVAKLREGDAERGVRAWARVVKAASCHSFRPSIDADPQLAECVRLLGGWTRLGQMRVHDEPFEAKRFAEVFAFSSAGSARMRIEADQVRIGGNSERGSRAEVRHGRQEKIARG